MKLGGLLISECVQIVKHENLVGNSAKFVLKMSDLEIYDTYSTNQRSKKEKMSNKNVLEK